MKKIKRKMGNLTQRIIILVLIMISISVPILVRKEGSKEDEVKTPYVLNNPDKCTYKISEDKPLKVIVKSVNLEAISLGRGTSEKLTLNFERYDNNESGILLVYEDSHISKEDYRILKKLKEGDVIEIYAIEDEFKFLFIKLESFTLKFNWINVDVLNKELAY